MKKVLCVLLMLLLTLSLASCSSDGQANSPAASTNTSSGSSAPEESVSDTPAPEEIPFTEVVAVDNENCVIRITEIDPDNLWGYTLSATLENRSADKTYMFSVASAAINCVQCDPLFAAEVAAGKKSNENISFSDSALSDNGVNDFTDIELTFRVYDSNDWTAEDAALETVHIYPYGEERAAAYVREAQPDDLILVDNEYATVIVTGYDPDNFWGYSVNLFLVNKTDAVMMVSVENASINGYMADPFYAQSVAAGKCAFSTMSWFDTELEKNEITAVEEIEFLLKVYNADDWMADAFANETVTLNP